MTNNRDFRVHPRVETLVEYVPAWLRPLLVGMQRDVEDFLNGRVLRHRRTVTTAGTAVGHGSTTWVTVTPTTALTYEKANPNSVLAVSVHTHGVHGFAAGLREFGVQVKLNGTTVGDFQVAASGVTAAQATAGDAVSISGDAEIACPGAGTVTLTLRFKAPTGATWSPQVGDTLSIACIETPPQ